jgi:sulfite reductase alpha subunit-like flavoprotein
MGRPRKIKEEDSTLAQQVADANADLKKEAQKEKEAIKAAKHEDKQGEFYNKNVRYKFKDGTYCTVRYNNSKEIVERIMKLPKLLGRTVAVDVLSINTMAIAAVQYEAPPAALRKSLVKVAIPLNTSPHLKDCFALSAKK